MQCHLKIPCASCPWNYAGETKRSFTTRRKEHMRNLKHCTKGSNVAKHAWTFNHVIDFNNSKIIDKANNRNRKTLESWHTAKTIGADNNSCPLPRPHSLKETLIFLAFFNILSSTCFYLLSYANFPLYLNFFRFYSSHVFYPLKTAVQSVKSS